MKRLTILLAAAISLLGQAERPLDVAVNRTNSFDEILQLAPGIGGIPGHPPWFNGNDLIVPVTSAEAIPGLQTFSLGKWVVNHATVVGGNQAAAAITRLSTTYPVKP